jgi:MFS family permease
MSAPRPRAETTSVSSAEFRAVIGVSLFIMFGYGLIVPTLPLFAKKFGVAEAGIGVLFGAFAAMRLLADFVVGRAIDRFGERSVVAAGAAIVGVSSAAAGAAPTFFWLVVLRGVGGAGSALFLGALTAHIVGTVTSAERGRAMGAFQGSIQVGLLLGPVFGGLIGSWLGVEVPLYVYGAICIAASPLCLRAMRERHVPAVALDEAPALGDALPASSAPAWGRLRPLFRDSAYRAALLGSAAGMYLAGGIPTLVSGFWVDVLDHSKSSVGVPYTVLGLTSLLVVWHAGSLSDRLGRRVVLIPSLAATAAVTLVLGAAHNAGTFIGLMAVLGAASGYARPGPTSIVADVSSTETRAVAVAGYRFAADLGAFVAPIVVGIVAQYVGYGPAFVALGSMPLVAAAAVWLARETAPAGIEARRARA